MTEVDIADETFVVADRDELAAVLSAGELWRSWWPGLELTVVHDRGSDGIRWSVTGQLAGSAEIWLEPWRDGVIVHWFLRADRTGTGGVRWLGRWRSRHASPDAIRRRLVLSFKRRIHALKDELERDRAAGAGRVGWEGIEPRVWANG